MPHSQKQPKSRLAGVSTYCTRFVAAILVVCTGLAPESPGQTQGDQPPPVVRRASEFPLIEAAYKPLEKFVSASAVLVGKTSLSDALEVLALEEHGEFTCVVGGGASEAGRLTRRFIVLNRSTFIVDDHVTVVSPKARVRWQLDSPSRPMIDDDCLRIAAADEELVCRTVSPVSVALKTTRREAAGDDGSARYETDVATQSDLREVRLLYVLHVGKSGEAGPSVKSEASDDGLVTLTVSTADRVFQLSLPPREVGAGYIEILDADGKSLLPRRLLASGILPHGPEGIKMLQRWDRYYQGDRKPAWDTGRASHELKQAVEDGVIKPGRAVVLGCGSGNNAIYLASQGFDVTGIDIAPTALKLAEAAAVKAGVKVNWVLADVLAPPSMEAFDFIYDRGCYHNVRYVDASGFVDSVRRLSRPGTQMLIMSLDREGPPGVKEEQLKSDFSSAFEFQWIRKCQIELQRDATRQAAALAALLKRQ